AGWCPTCLSSLRSEEEPPTPGGCTSAAVNTAKGASTDGKSVTAATTAQNARRRVASFNRRERNSALPSRARVRSRHNALGHDCNGRETDIRSSSSLGRTARPFLE